MTTSELPSNYTRPFTKDTLEGDYHGFRREIWSRSGFDDGEKGVGGAMLFFALIGFESAITASIFTDIFLPETVEKWVPGMHPHSMGGIVDFHWGFEILSIEPRTDCLLIPGGKCWGISTTQLGEQIHEALARQGFEGVWHDLHEMLVDQTKVQLEEE